MKNFNLTPEQYWAIYEAQGGKCYLCQRASGRTKRLAVDHDHSTGLVRGLLCSHDNLKVIGHSRDSVEFFQRGVVYLTNPPAFDVIGRVVVPDTCHTTEGREHVRSV